MMKIKFINQEEIIVKTIDNIKNKENELFCCQTKSLLFSYGTKFNFLSFYIAYDEEKTNKNIAVITFFDNISILCLSKFFDENKRETIDDIFDFVFNFKGASEIVISQKNFNKINYKKANGFLIKENYLMTKSHNNIKNETLMAETIDSRDFFNFLVSNSDIEFEQEKMYVDLSHRVRHGQMKLFSLKDRFEIVAVCCVGYQDEELKYITALSVKKDKRNSGLNYGKKLLQNVISKDKKRTYLLTDNDKLKEYYEKLDFKMVDIYYNISIYDLNLK